MYFLDKLAKAEMGDVTLLYISFRLDVSENFAYAKN